ncbi:hypothetical protein BRC93_13505 [Halobacteriales archaeon QS_5_70_15]|nr:MAG: hypothetical protein BRC93_13505 [Halobacteriales archaeon QS_5_70_15]
MEWSPVAVAFLLVAGLFLVAAWTAWRHREAPGAGLFAAVAGLTVAGALAIGAAVVLDLPRMIILASAITTSLLVPVPWLLFSFEYTGRNELVSAGIVGITATVPGVGLVATALIFGSQFLSSLRLPSPDMASGLYGVIVTVLGIVQWLALLYAGGLILIGSGILLWTFHRYEHLDSATGTVLGVFGTVPWMSLLFGIRIEHIAPLALPRTSAVGFLAGAIAVVSGLKRYRLFQNVPGAHNIAPATVIEELEDVVIVIDGEGTVVEVNPAAKQVLDITTPEVVGADIEGLLEAPFPDLRETETVELQASTGRELFEPTVSELTGQHGHCIGYTIALRNVTSRITRQQRLEVLNRVLRHNLRNDMNVVLGQVELLQKSVDDPTLVGYTETIVRTARDLTRFSEEAREIDQLMATTDRNSRDVPLSPLVEELLASITADHPRTTYDYDVPSGVVFGGSEDLIRLALTKLVENAIQHNDTTEPCVEIRASYDPDRTYPLSVSVLDNGPGIPDHERKAIVQGDESPLQHGSGLGLWVVRWIATRLGGEIDIKRREPRGTIVTLNLPRAHRSKVETSVSGGGRD